MFKRFLKYLLITTTLLGTLLFSIPFIVPLESFRTILEEQLSQSIGRKVIIGALTPHAVPLPALTATNVSILNSPDQPGELFVEQMRTTLDPLALLDGKIIINTISSRKSKYSTFSTLLFMIVTCCATILYSPKHSSGSCYCQEGIVVCLHVVIVLRILSASEQSLSSSYL